MTARFLVTSLFVLLGALVYFGQRGLYALAPPSQAAVSASAHSEAGPSGARAVERALLWEAERRGLHLDDAVVRDRLVRNMRFVDPTTTASDEALFQVAIALGMHRSDPIARARLCQRTGDVLLAESGLPDPSDATLQRYLEQHAARFQRPESVAFRQVFFAADGSGEGATQRARAELERLRGQGIEAGTGRGDPTLLPARMQASPAQVEGRFGSRFARRLSELDAGRWQGPVESSFGAHLVWIEHRREAALPQLSDVAPAVRAEQRHDVRERRRREVVEALRERHASLGEQAP